MFLFSDILLFAIVRVSFNRFNDMGISRPSGPWCEEKHEALVEIAMTKLANIHARGLPFNLPSKKLLIS